MTTMTLQAFPTHVEEKVAAAVRDGLGNRAKRLPPWLFYDEAGSRLFEEITERPEYYLTRTERGIFQEFSDQILELASGGARLRIAELGAGSAEKTRLLLAAAMRRQGPVIYEPLDVSVSALAAARQRIERELQEVAVTPRALDYTNGLTFGPAGSEERRLVLYIGSSIGNFEPEEAARLLRKIRTELKAGDALLLGVDMVKDESTLLAAYDDAAGVTADFNLNMLTRLNREVGAEFELDSFEHLAVWNEAASRIEMHLESRVKQSVWVAAMDMRVEFAKGERIHTENSYKYRPGQVEAMLAAAGFTHEATWTDENGWFAVCLGRVNEHRGLLAQSGMSR